MSIRLLLLVGLGGFLGTVLRYSIQIYIDRSVTMSFPLAIFLINLVGSFLIGIIFGLFLEKNVLSDEWVLFLATGFCGGFTTFSAFSFGNLKLLQTAEYGPLLSYSVGSVILGILATFLGIWLMRWI